MAGLIGQLTVHVFQHPLRSPLHERKIEIIEQLNVAFVQSVAHLLERQLPGLDPFAVHQHKTAGIIANERDSEDQRTTLGIAGRQPLPHLNSARSFHGLVPALAQIFIDRLIGRFGIRDQPLQTQGFGDAVVFDHAGGHG